MKLFNSEKWTNWEPQQLAKIRVLKVNYFILPLFLVPKLRSVAQNEWKKSENPRKNSKNLKVAGNYPNI